MKVIKDTLCLLSLILCAAHVVAEEPTTLNAATQEEIASCGTKLALAYTLRNMIDTLPPVAGVIAAGFVSNITYQALSGSSEMVARGAALTAALMAFPITGLIGSGPSIYLSSTYEKTFDAKSFELIKDNARTKSLNYGAYVFWGIVGSLLTGVVALAIR